MMITMMKMETVMKIEMRLKMMMMMMMIMGSDRGGGIRRA